MLHLCQCLTVSASTLIFLRAGLETEVCGVNDAALYCNDSNDHQSVTAHLRASDHRVQR